MTAAAAPRDALAEAREHGIHCLPIPTPFLVGRVNTYVIEDDPLTMIDSGPNSGLALHELEQQLAAVGHTLDEIGLIVISHQHIDHLGLADIVSRRSGAEVAALGAMAPVLADFSAEMAAEDEFAQRVMLAHGIPEDIVSALTAVSAAFRGWGSSVNVTRPLEDGDVISLRDRKLEVLWRPGHSPSDVLLWDAERGIMFAGDHLIAHISSNPLIHRPLGARADRIDQRPQALVTYIESLRRTMADPARMVLSGHGEVIVDHRDLIDRRFKLHERRAARILGLIRSKPQTAHDVAQSLWGNVAVTQAYLTLSEVLGHTDVLENEGSIVEVERDGIVTFEAV